LKYTYAELFLGSDGFEECTNFAILEEATKMYGHNYPLSAAYHPLNNYPLQTFQLPTLLIKNILLHNNFQYLLFTLHSPHYPHSPTLVKHQVSVLFIYL
jgi:hypothetical protein